MNWLLAQADEVGQAVMPDWTWWANWGVLGVFAFVVISTGLYFGHDWWKARKPFWERKWKAEAEREEAQVALFNELRASEPEKLACQQRQVTLIESVVVTTGKIAKNLGVE